jgi:ATP-dependent Clp protease ATP-binding subunit ClpA
LVKTKQWAEIIEVFQTFVAGLNPPGRPIANFLFLGPTGSGKTRVVEAMAQALFGNPLACIKIDCAEFQHSHEMGKLIPVILGQLGPMGRDVFGLPRACGISSNGHITKEIIYLK